MLKIRLKKFGAHKNPFFRIVVADARVQRDGIEVAELGYYDVTKKNNDMKINVEEAKKWIKNGAQPTKTVSAILKKAGAI